MLPRRIAPLLCFITFGLAACDGGGGGGDGESLTADNVAAYEGVYEISAWTQTDDAAGCEAEGADQLASATDLHFVIAGAELFGTHFAELVACTDVADCQSKASSIESQEYGYSATFNASLTEPAGDDELAGGTVTSGFNEDGICVDRRIEEHTLTRSGDTLTLRTVTKNLEDRPQQDGFCVASTEEAKQEATTAPCASVRVVTAIAVDL